MINKSVRGNATTENPNILDNELAQYNINIEHAMYLITNA
jgi:hypothetical protein